MRTRWGLVLVLTVTVTACAGPPGAGTPSSPTRTASPTVTGAAGSTASTAQAWAVSRDQALRHVVAAVVAPPGFEEVEPPGAQYGPSLPPPCDGMAVRRRAWSTDRSVAQALDAVNARRPAGWRDTGRGTLRSMTIQSWEPLPAPQWRDPRLRAATIDYAAFPHEGRTTVQSTAVVLVTGGGCAGG